MVEPNRASMCIPVAKTETLNPSAQAARISGFILP
jgi:hypothetical protein